MTIPEYEGHRHGLAQRPAQGEGDTAENAQLGVREHHILDHFPLRGPDGVGRFLDHRGGQIERIARDARGERDDHDGEDDACRQQVDAHGSALEQDADEGQFPDAVLERRFDILGHDGSKGEQAPHAVNDARDGGQQFYGDADGSFQIIRRDLGHKDRDTDSRGNGEEQGKAGREERAVNGRCRAEHSCHGVPCRRGQKTDHPELPYGERGLF